MTTATETTKKPVTETKNRSEAGTGATGQLEGRTGNAGGDEKGRNVRPRRPTRGRERKPRAEYQQKIVSIRRVTRVMRGGRRFSFSVSVVIGDKKGKVGVGMAKAGDTALAIEKAYNQAKRNLIQVQMTKSGSVPHEVQARHTSSEVLIKPARGKGVVAGGTVRTVLELAGVSDVSAKILSRSKNPFNNAKVAIKALSQLAEVKAK